MPDYPQEHFGYKIVLDKLKWLRGEEACKNPYLIEPGTGRYDVVAKMMIDIGYSTTHLKGKRWPCQVVQAFGRNERMMEPLRWMVSKAQADTEECVALITINDDPTIDDDTRIKRIRTIINKHDLGLIITDSSAVKKEEPKQKVTVVNDSTASYVSPFGRPISDNELRQMQEMERMRRHQEEQRRQQAEWRAFRTEIFSTDSTF